MFGDFCDVVVFVLKDLTKAGRLHVPKRFPFAQLGKR